MIPGNPLVSVLIPAYNVSDYILKSVSSILAQSYTNLEIWLIDDASTDDTLQKMQSIKDDRIIIKAFRENTQKVGAVNNVLSLVKGDFICFQDADDWSEPDRVSEQLRLFEFDKDLGICFTGYKFANRKRDSNGFISITNEELQAEFLRFRKYSKPAQALPTLCATMMISREVLNRTSGYHSFFAGRVGEDIQWVYRILKDFKGLTIDKPLYTYNSRDGSLSHIQASGFNAKYIYSWCILSKIIDKDINENIDILAPHNEMLLRGIELQACEEMLVEATRELQLTRLIYSNSASYKIGRAILFPWRLLKSFIR